MPANPTELDDIFARAAARGVASNLPYAGEVTPQEAHRLFVEFGAKIIDVRSAFENSYIGRVVGAPLISWKFWPGSKPNPDFLAELKRQCAPADIVLFLCRSGVRSHATAVVAAEAGFAKAFNILEGFEGDLDHAKQRGKLGGWRKAGLPWVQD